MVATNPGARSLVVLGLGLAVATSLPVTAWAGAASTDDVGALFATTCGWCHEDGGRRGGKGPQLMNTTRSDDFIRNRIKHGKPGRMPSFGRVFNDTQIDAIIHYIRTLKPDANSGGKSS